mgnify:CR=1 FL=1
MRHFPIWNIPLKHPVNLAYEAATADLNDVNMIDPFHLEAYGSTAVNYNRDIEIYPVLNAILEEIYGENTYYKSPTDMGVNMAGNCIIDDEACCEASKMEIIRRYYDAVNRVAKEEASESEVYKIELLRSRLRLQQMTERLLLQLRREQRSLVLRVPLSNLMMVQLLHLRLRIFLERPQHLYLMHLSILQESSTMRSL